MDKKNTFRNQQGDNQYDPNSEITNMTPTVSISPLLSELYHDEYFHLGILTSNTQENVQQFLEKNELFFFEFIRTGKSVFGKSHIINKIIKQRKVNQSEVFYVCDEVRDIEAARKSGIQSIAVTWGKHQRCTHKRKTQVFGKFAG